MRSASKIKSGICAWLFAMVVTLCLGETCVGAFLETPQPASGVFEAVSPEAIGGNYDASAYDASGYAVAPKSTAFKNWNQFQAGTTGQFASRAEAGAAWNVYKGANGIVTGAVRSSAAKSQFLRGMAEGGNAPKWMNQWLQNGKVPPGYHVDHIKPLSIGGVDAPANMRLLDIDMHKTHHLFYHPWR